LAAGVGFEVVTVVVVGGCLAPFWARLAALVATAFSAAALRLLLT